MNTALMNRCFNSEWSQPFEPEYSRTAIVIDQYIVSGGIEFRVALNDIVFGDDINELGCLIIEKIKEQVAIASLVFDLTLCDSYRFKPRRLFGLCSYIANYLKEMNIAAQLKLILTKAQNEIFNITMEAQFCSIEIVDNTVTANISDVICNASIGQVKYYYCAISIAVLCVIGVVVGIFNYSGTIIGCILTYSSGLLLIEAMLILKLLFNKSKTKDGHASNHSYN